jgi:hypothetical protein
MPGSTTNFGFEYPLDTDPLADGAQEIQNFAETADTTFADLKGGTTDQVLAKNSNTDMDFKWVGSATNAPAPDSTYYISNLSTTWGDGMSAMAGGLTDDTMYLVPIFISEDMTIDRIAVEVTTAAATSTVRLGLYSSTDNVPSALIADFGTVASDTTGVKEKTISQAVSKGLIWAAYVCSNSSSVRLRQISDGYQTLTFGTSAAQMFDQIGYTQTGVTGALPNPTTATIKTSGQVAFNGIVALRRA